MHRHVGDGAYVPANLAGAAVAVLVAAASGRDAGDLGLDPAEVRRGLAWGALGAAVVGAGVVGALAHPRTRVFFEGDHDERSGSAAYHLGARIPLGTALAEELIFRGAVQAVISRGRPAWQANAVTSVLFGVWHVWPTHESLDRNPVAGTLVDRPSKRAGAVAGTVATTAVAGVGLSWLRTRSRSLVAPVLAHAAVNMLGYLGGRLAASRGS